MVRFQLTDQQKDMLRAIVPGLKDGSIKTEWQVLYMHDRTQLILAHDKQENGGTLSLEAWKGVNTADFDDFIALELFRRSRTDSRGLPTHYTLHKRRIIELVEQDFTDPVERSVVPEIQHSLERFHIDYPLSVKTTFIMMSFGKTAAHIEIAEIIKETLRTVGIVGLRADDKTYHPELYSNVVTYMHGCQFGIAVFDNMSDKHYNPNVALEVGYMLALKKKVCLLKDKTLLRMQADLMGWLHHEFDPENIRSTISTNLSKWLADNIL